MKTSVMQGRSLRKRIRNYLIFYSIIIIVLPVWLADYLGEMYEDHQLRKIVNKAFTEYKESKAYAEKRVMTKKGKLRFYLWSKNQLAPKQIPQTIVRLLPGEHNDIEVGGHEYFVLVRDAGDLRLFMRYNKTDFENPEDELFFYGIFFFTLVLVAAVIMSHYLSKRFMQPVTALSSQIKSLNPECRGLQINYDQQEEELKTISVTVNQYLSRLDEYVDRELEFLETASHELRTPITIIKGAVELMKDNPAIQKLDLPAVARIDNAAFDMLSMVEALLFLAKDPHQIDSLFEPVNLNKLIKDCLEDSKYVSNRDDISYTLTLDNTTIMAPKFLSKIVISNLLRNAINYTNHGNIDIRLRSHALTISNEGDPINLQSEISVFEKRVRGNNNNGNGAGLGLYIIKKICTQLQWKINLTSSEKNKTSISLEFNRIVTEGN